MALSKPTIRWMVKLVNHSRVFKRKRDAEGCAICYAIEPHKIKRVIVAEVKK